MTATFDIARLRLHNQHLVGPRLASPHDVVRWLGAVQAQDYGGAKWGVAQRTADSTDADLDREFDAGTILRTHMMRPTWHFVLPSEIRWLQKLTAPRVHAVNAYAYRQHELDDAVLKRSHVLLERALRDGKHLTRAEVGAALEQGGVSARGQRLAYAVMHAELEALVCSGPRRGKQFTYGLLEERVPPAPALARDEALAALTRRYFTSHGPAIVQDYAWWSGLSVADARAGIELVRSGLLHETVNDRVYWFVEPAAPPSMRDPVIHLLPNYDEHVVAYKDHRPSFEESVRKKLVPGDDTLFAHIIIRNGNVIGGWRRKLNKKAIDIEITLLVKINKAAQTALLDAVQAYSRFLGVPVTVSSL